MRTLTNHEQQIVLEAEALVERANTLGSTFLPVAHPSSGEIADQIRVWGENFIDTEENGWIISRKSGNRCPIL